jgi:hypothetical protein
MYRKQTKVEKSESILAERTLLSLGYMTSISFCSDATLRMAGKKFCILASLYIVYRGIEVGAFDNIHVPNNAILIRNHANPIKNVAIDAPSANPAPNLTASRNDTLIQNCLRVVTSVCRSGIFILWSPLFGKCHAHPCLFVMDILPYIGKKCFMRFGWRELEYDGILVDTY